MGLLSALHWYFFFNGKTPQGTLFLVIGKIAFFVIWGGLTNVILWLAWRYPISKSTVPRNFVVLFAGSLAICSIYYAFYALTLSLFLSDHMTVGLFWGNYRFVLSQHSTWYYLMYWASVVAESLARKHRETLQRQQIQSDIEQQITQLRLATLQSRLQPHFFFNCLNLISAQIANGKQEQAQETLIEVSNLLRQSLTTSRTTNVTLADEIEFCRRFLRLLTSRFRDRLNFEFDVATNILDAEIPSLLLQPLIENAVKHGVGANRGPASINVSCKSSANRLIVRVENRGKLNGSGGELEPGAGFGLTATRDLLRLLYDEDFQFSAGRSGAEEFTALISIPLRRTTKECPNVIG